MTGSTVKQDIVLRAMNEDTLLQRLCRRLMQKKGLMSVR